MDNYRAILAIVLAFFILLGYQYLIVGPGEEQPVVEDMAEVEQLQAPVQGAQPQPAPAEIVYAVQPAEFEQQAAFQEPASLPSQAGKDIVVETGAFTTVITETGGGLKSYKLNKIGRASCRERV